MFKVNYKNHQNDVNNSEHISHLVGVSFVNFEQVNVIWVAKAII